MSRDGAPEVIGAFKQGKADNCTSIGFIKAVLNAFDGDIARVFRSFSPGERCAMPALRDDCDAAWTQRVSLRAFTARTMAGDPIAVTCDELGAGAAESHLCQIDRGERGDHLIDAARSPFTAMAKACARQCERGAASACALVNLRDAVYPECEHPPQGDAARCAQLTARDVCTIDHALAFLDAGLDYRVAPALLGLESPRDWAVVEGGKIGRWWRTPRFVSGHRSCVVAKRKHTFFVSQGWADIHGDAKPFSSKFGSWLGFASVGAYCLRFDDPQQAPALQVAADAEQPPPAELADPEIASLERAEQ